MNIEGRTVNYKSGLREVRMLITFVTDKIQRLTEQLGYLRMLEARIVERKQQREK